MQNITFCIQIKPISQGPPHTHPFKSGLNLTLICDLLLYHGASRSFFRSHTLCRICSSMDLLCARWLETDIPLKSMGV